MLRMPAAMLVLGVVFWIGGMVMQITSPTSPDPGHTFPLNNHGTLHYLTWQVHCLPWPGLALGVVGLLMYWIRCRRIARQLGISVDDVMGIRRT